MTLDITPKPGPHSVTTNTGEYLMTMSNSTYKRDFCKNAFAMQNMGNYGDYSMIFCFLGVVPDRATLLSSECV